ncbi:MAG: hypothetical protein IT307_12565 [Chloroflexi bacterium]|nr:hypothetical protein [Chloroflexota bacterium]
MLTTGDGFLALEPRGDSWNVVRHARNALPSLVARGLELGDAQGIAEDRARALGAGALVDPDAPWRQRPASEKQTALLRRKGVRVTATLTAGEASDLIAAALAGVWR